MHLGGQSLSCLRTYTLRDTQALATCICGLVPPLPFLTGHSSQKDLSQLPRLSHETEQVAVGLTLSGETYFSSKQLGQRQPLLLLAQ